MTPEELKIFLTGYINGRKGTDDDDLTKPILVGTSLGNLVPLSVNDFVFNEGRLVLLVAPEGM
jgi:hypothetical protein